MRQTTRQGETPEQTYTETTVGDAPASMELSQNAKGTWQLTVKLYFATPDELLREGPDLAAKIRYQVAERFTLAG